MEQGTVDNNRCKIRNNLQKNLRYLKEAAAATILGVVEAAYGYLEEKVTRAAEEAAEAAAETMETMTMVVAAAAVVEVEVAAVALKIIAVIGTCPRVRKQNQEEEIHIFMCM